MSAFAPAQSVPAVVVLLEVLPLTANGKVDRAALPAPDERTGVPLGGELEQLVAGVCSDMLGIPVRYADDDLLSLGADSLLVGRMAVRLTGELDLDVAPGLIFRHPTVGGLAQALLALLLEDTGAVLEDLASPGQAMT